MIDFKTKTIVTNQKTDETNMPLEIILKVTAQKGMNCNEVELKRSENIVQRGNHLAYEFHVNA